MKPEMLSPKGLTPGSFLEPLEPRKAQGELILGTFQGNSSKYLPSTFWIAKLHREAQGPCIHTFPHPLHSSHSLLPSPSSGSGPRTKETRLCLPVAHFTQTSGTLGTPPYTRNGLSQQQEDPTLSFAPWAAAGSSLAGPQKPLLVFPN